VFFPSSFPSFLVATLSVRPSVTPGSLSSSAILLEVFYRCNAPFCSWFRFAAGIGPAFPRRDY
jgi:hypothetical protein